VVVLRPTSEEHPSDLALPIWIGPNEAAAIGIALEDQPSARPLTHDLLVSAIHALDAQIDRILIDHVEGSTFFATVVLAHDKKTLRLDARPSDSIALAVRTGAPLFVSEEILNTVALPYRGSFDRQNENDIKEFREFLESVKPEDFTSQD